MLFGVASRDRTYYDGSCHQFSGHARMAVFTVGIDKSTLDAPVKRVGFMGTDNDQPLQKEVPPTDEYENGLWDLEFELYRYIMGEKSFHQIKGAFYVETTNETYYWLKDRSANDFEFNSDSRLVLNDWFVDP